MSLGGGTFISQNKVLPGSYINFVSASSASAALSERGIVAVPLSMDWGPENNIFEVDAETVASNSMKLFGYAYTDDQMKDVREIFKHARKAFIYRLNGGGVKASATISALTVTAKNAGTKGNEIKIVIAANILDNTKFDITTYLGSNKVDLQTAVANIAGLASNDYVTFSGTGSLTAAAGTTLTGGTNVAVTGTQHSAFLDAAEAHSFNVLICPTADSATIALYVAYVKRRRDDNGVKFQLVVYRTASDYEGIISVENTVMDSGANAYSLVFWTGGIAAGVAVNKSNTNKAYDGEYTVNTVYTQVQLESNLKAGKFMFHKNGDTVRILSDVNTLVTLTNEKGSDFQSNQTMRVLDQIANDIAVLFNTKYLGEIPNNSAGRTSFWNDVVKYHQELQKISAIEDFEAADVTILQGDTKKSVVVNNAVTVVNAMEQLYMTTVVS